MKLNDILKKIEKKYPLFLQYDWDNSGLNIGNRDMDIKKILLTLEVTKATIDEAIENDVDLIISHHPFIFSKMKSIVCDDVKGKEIYRLIQNNIAVYAMHTNLDVAEDGLNDYFLSLVGIKDSEIFIVEGINENYINSNPYGLGRVASTNPTTVRDIALKLKNILKTEDIRIIGDPEKEVNKFSIVTGSGSEFFSDAKSRDCQLHITGDVKYHTAVDSIALGVNIIDCGHYGSEHIFTDFMEEKLKEMLSNVEIIKTKSSINPFSVV